MAKKSNAPRGKKANGKHPAAGRKVTRKHNIQPALSAENFEAKRESFLQHRKLIENHHAKELAAKALRLKAQKDAKADGFPAKLFVIARDLCGTDKQAAKVKGEVRDRLTVARYLGDPLGEQLDLFVDATKVEQADFRAEGEQASRDNKPARPPYDPGTDAYNQWMEGYQAHQSTLMKGFKPLPPADGFDDDLDPARPM